MNSDQTPFRSEVMRWSPHQLAAFLKRRNLTDCDKAVLKYSISGSRFVNLSENDLEKFPTLQAPLIAKISTEIGKKEPLGIFRKKLSKVQEPDTAAVAQGWGHDEFFDDDYEYPNSGDEEGSVGDYESPNDDLEEDCHDYEPTPSLPPEDLRYPTLPISAGEYIDRRADLSRGPPPDVCPRPPVPSMGESATQMAQKPSSTRRDHSPHSGGGPPGKQPPEIFRCRKPFKGLGACRSPIRVPHLNTEDRIGTHPWTPKPDVPDHSTWSIPPVLPLSSTSISRSNSSPRPPPNRFDVRREETHDEAPTHIPFPLLNKPPRHILHGLPSRSGDSSLPPTVTSGVSRPPKLRPAMTEQRSNFVDRQSYRLPPSTTPYTQGLEPCWYVGNVGRNQAGECLKQLHKDGAYLVRDSTKQLPTQPFTLVVFYQDRVYNIQIRQQNQQFLLGSGLNVQEAFPSVSDIIGHYSQCPLRLIDAENPGQHNECILSDPAGYHMTQQNGSLTD